jgi:predicted unusual protein kinase regulating ubiquinone biosynthesis (AarF/ABC1/UbiB family)
MHADLHPGNIMVDAHHRQMHSLRSAKDERALTTMNDPTFRQQTQSDILSAMDDAMDHIRLTLVDAGMVAKLTDEESSAFIGLLSSLGEGNGDEAASYTLQFSLDRNAMTLEQKRFFAADMVLLFNERCLGYGTNVDVGYVLRGVLNLIRKHRVRIDANFATLVINCLCIESLARRVCPNYNVLDAGRPLLQGYRRLLLQHNGKRPVSSPWFAIRMTLNALKKEFKDRLFFRQEAKRKYEMQSSLVQRIQG